MKKPLTAFCRPLLLALALGMGYTARGQVTYSQVPLTASSFTADIIANGAAASPPASSTTADVDGTGYYFLSQDYYTATTAHTSGIPNNGLISNSISGYSGLTYQLASLSANNALRIAGGAVGTGTITFATPTAASEVYVLASSGSGISTVDMTVTYSDATTTAFTAQTVPDWFTASATLNVFGMSARASATTPVSVVTAANTAPFFDQIKLTIPAAKTGTTITGISFSKTSTAGYLQVMAVSVGTYPLCTAPPTAGTATASAASLCAGGTSTLSLTGVNAATGLTYQWQSSTTSATTGFTDIAGATSSTYTTPALTQTTYYRAVVTCSGQSANSTVATVTVSGPTYATVPYTQGFENTWLSRCATDEAPDASWLNTPATGNASWRRDDDGASASWTAVSSGAYTPAGSNAGGASSSHSARFHNYYVSSGTVGTLDLYVNMSGGTGTPTLKFDYRNSDTNAVVVLLSTDGGATFSTTPLQTLGNQAAWTSYIVTLPATVTPTTVIRFRATGNFASYDNGIDNVSVSYVSCAQPTAIAATTTAAGATVSASVTFTPAAGATNYAFTISPAVTGAPTTVTASPFTLTGLAYSTTYTIALTTNCGGTTSQAATYTFTTPCAPPVYATLPYTQGFEGTWLSRCGTDDAPDNSWANTPLTGNNSWRRDDDGASANWSSNAGAYTPAGSQGSSHSARFHSYNASSGTTGTLDLYANLSAAGLKRLTFDYVNVSTAGSKLDVLLSTDGGATFSTTPLLTITTSATFTAQAVDLTTTSATAVIRFRATSDFGSYDIGVDNVQLSVPPAVDITPTALATPPSTQTCYGSAEAIAVTVKNQGSLGLNFVTNPATITAVVTTPSGSQTLTGSITTGTLAAGATQNVTLTPTLNMSATGTYTFAITATVTGDANTANDLLTPAPTRTVSAPVAGTLAPAATSICVSGTATLTLAGAANGSIQYQSSTSATGPFTNISGATSAAYTTPVLTATTYYRAQVTCGTNVATSNVSTITVNNPLVASTNTPVAICAGSTATLTATPSAGSSVRFYTTATGGTALTSTGTNSYTTPALTTNTTYYAEAYTPNGGSENVGPTAQTSTGLSAQTGGALYFTATAPVTIQSVTVYLAANQAAGTVTIALRTGSSTTGAIVNSQNTAFAIPANTTAGVVSYVVPLNYSIPAAGQYTLHLASATQGGLLRDNAGANTTGYPYTSPSGTISITGTSVAGYYYYFYNWVLSSDCVNAAARTAVQVNVTPAPVATFSYPATGSNCAGSTGTVTPTLATGTTAGTFSSTTGLTLNATTGVVNLATSTAGTYTVTNTVAASGGCAATTATATLTVNPTPARPTLTPTYNGTQTTLTSSAATGNQYYYNGVAITGATGQTYVVNGSASTYGSYTVVVTNSFGCSSQASVATTVTTTKGSIAGASIELFPNPTPDGRVTLALSGLRSATQLTVIDALGRVVRTEQLPATVGTVTHALDLSGQASGVYLLRLTNAEGVETRRLTRQ